MKQRIRKIALIGLMASGLGSTAMGDDTTPPEPRDFQVVAPATLPDADIPAALPTTPPATAGDLTLTPHATKPQDDPVCGTKPIEGAEADIAIDENDLELIQERYASGAVKIERHVKQDADLNYVKHGSWRYLSEQGGVISEGLYFDGKMHGAWQRWHRGDDAPIFQEKPYDQFTDPFFSEATFKNGRLDGTWVIYDSKQRTASVIELKEGLRDGVATWYYPSGQKSREIAFTNGIVNGELKRWDEAGEVTVSKTYLHGRLLDVQTTMFEGTQIKKSEVSYLSPQTVIDKPDDWWYAKTAEFTSTGDKQRHGDWTNYYKNGQKQGQGKHLFGKPVGRYESWHENGQIASQGQYEDGQQIGKWVWWHANGQKYVEGDYVAGKETGLWVWWKTNGSVARKQQMGQTNVANKPVDGKTL